MKQTAHLIFCTIGILFFSCKIEHKENNIEYNPIDQAWKYYIDTIRWDSEELLITRDYLLTEKIYPFPPRDFFDKFPLDNISEYIMVIDTSAGYWHKNFTPETWFLPLVDSVYCRDEMRWLKEPRVFKQVGKDTIEETDFSVNLKAAWKDFVESENKPVLVEISPPIATQGAYYIRFSLFSRFGPEYVIYTVVMDKKKPVLLRFKRREGAEMGKNFIHKRLFDKGLVLLDSLWAPKYSIDSLSLDFSGEEFLESLKSL